MGDIGSAIIGLAIAGVVLGAIVATAAIFALPCLWAMAKSTLRALVG
jgi:UDP-N-acetylmuramyl pentapeptide phosphotransferase/UDP-N-acetylglucosamine-1-phosphate transferase